MGHFRVIDMASLDQKVDEMTKYTGSDSASGVWFNPAQKPRSAQTTECAKSQNTPRTVLLAGARIWSPRVRATPFGGDLGWGSVTMGVMALVLLDLITQSIFYKPERQKNKNITHRRRQNLVPPVSGPPRVGIRPEFT